MDAAFQEFVKTKEITEQENKMLLSEIVFLRDKAKNRNSNISGVFRESRKNNGNKSQIFNLDS